MTSDDVSPDYVRVDEMVEAFDDDPFRFLDGPLPPTPRIRGLATRRDVANWRAAEKKLAKIKNREPRDRILAALDDRDRRLAEIGEFDPDPDARPERTITLGITSDVLDDVFDPGGPRRVSRIPPTDAPTVADDAGPDWITYEWDPDVSRARLQDASDHADAVDQAVATDGGEPEQ